MTTKQLAARVRKYFRLYGKQNLSGIEISSEVGKTDVEMIHLTYLAEDDNEVGVFYDDNKWFIPLDEMTYKELNTICKRIEKNVGINKKKK